MRLRSPVALLLIAASVSVARPADAQIAEGVHYDPPSDSRLDEEGARAKLLHWIANAGVRRERHLYFRNTSDLPIEVTSWELYGCFNVTSVGCGVEHEGPTIEPGETIILATIRQTDLRLPARHMYRFSVRFAGPLETELTSSPTTQTPRRRSGWVPERFEYVDQVMPMLMRNHSVPGVAIVLIEDERVQWSAGYGVAYPDGPEVTPNTVFDVGSLGHPVIALTFLRLAEVRGWRVENPISSWAFESAIPDGFSTVSAASLLAHTGGVFFGPSPGEFLRESSSGAWQYSRAGYSLLQKLVEDSEGHDLEVLVRALVTEPHTLPTMSFLAGESYELARGHDRSGALLPDADSSAGNSGSPYFSSASDYAHFLTEVSPLSRRDPATWRRMTHARLAVQDDIGLSWGLGWAVVHSEDGSNIAFQWNSAPGFKSLALVDESRGRGVVILTNSENGLELAENVFKMLDPRTHAFLDFHMLHLDD